MKIEHTAIYFQDLEGAKQFFETYFNATANDLYHNEKTGFRSYFLSFDEGARLEIMNKEVLDDLPKPLNRTGLAHLTFALGAKEAEDELTHRLKNDGYEIISGPRTTGDGYYESCVLGFENNQIEITV